MSQLSPREIETFWRFAPIPIRGKECSDWTGSGVRYGVVKIYGRTSTASRLSWIIHNGPIPEGLDVCHKCDRPICVNPDHLFLGTKSQNIQDSIAKGRFKFNGKRGTEHYSTHFTEDDIREIRRRCANGESQTKMAAEYGVGQDEISRIKNRKRWKHVI